MCAYAHHTGVVTCILDAIWNPSRLVSRLTKAYAKGFHLPQGYDTLTSLGATLYRPKTLNDAEWQRELQRKWQIRMSKSNANKLFSEFESAFEIQVAAKNAKHYDTLKEALESSILPFTPEDYEGEMSYPHAREQEDKILAKPVSYLIVGPKPPLMAPGFRYGNQPKIVEQVPCVLLFD